MNSLPSNQPSEIEAAVSFQVQFSDRYGSNHVEFHNDTLERAIDKTCHVPIKSRKILGLYFHNKNDPFADVFCASIQSGEIRQILDKSFYFLGWDVAQKCYHNPLIKSLKMQFGSTSLESMIVEGRVGFLIIFATGGKPCMFSLLHASSNKCIILSTLKAAENSFINENNNERELQKFTKQDENSFGSEQFQQTMNDQLGNRDYDLFESDQHNALQQKIGFAKFGAPIKTSGYNEKQQKIIKITYDKLREYNNMYSEYQDQIIISVIYNCLEPLPDVKLSRAKQFSDYNPLTDLSPVPIFVIRKCINGNDSCRLFIDDDDRVYNSWEDYIEDNKHYKCIMVLPKGGRYIEDKNGHVILERHLSPSCGIKTQLLMASDIGTSVLGIGSGAVIGISLIPAITVAPIALTVAAGIGIGVGVYSIIRSAISIHDRRIHGQTMSFANSDARGAYLNIVAGSMGFVGAGATTALSQLAARGFNITKGVQYTVNTINVLNLTASGVSVGNSTHQVINDWVVEQRTPSALTIIQLTSSILFFANATYNFKSAAIITEEAQVNTLTKYQDSLRSNRHRKMFNKMLKETVRQNSGDRTAARAEVIFACKNIPDKNTVFAVLTRNNKLFNKDGINFFVKDGQIKLNGAFVDLIEFGDMSKAQKSQFLADLPVVTEPVQAHNAMNVSTQSILPNIEMIVMVSKYGRLIVNGCNLPTLLCEVVKDFSQVVQEKIFVILRAVLDSLLREFSAFDMIVKKYMPQYFSEPVVNILRLVLEYLKNLGCDRENESVQQSRNNEQQISRSQETIPTFFKKCLHWVEIGLELMLRAGGINAQLLKELVNYIYNVIVQKLFKYCDERERNACRRTETGRRITCGKCSGHYFSK